MSSLPGDALDALLARAADLVEGPWDADIAPPGSDPASRETTFGAGWGLIRFYVDDEAELIMVFDHIWIG